MNKILAFLAATVLALGGLTACGGGGGGTTCAALSAKGGGGGGRGGGGGSVGRSGGGGSRSGSGTKSKPYYGDHKYKPHKHGGSHHVPYVHVGDNDECEDDD